MRVLVVTNLYPTSQTPFSGTFIEQQVVALRQAGVSVDVLHVARQVLGAGAYRSVPGMVRRRIREQRPDIVHVMYGGILAAQVARAVRRIPLIISFAGSDLLGGHWRSPFNGGGARLPVRRRLMVSAGVIASRYAAFRASAVIVKSEPMKRALSPSTHGKCWVIPNGVNLERFVEMDRDECTDRLGWNREDFNVLFCSGFDRPEKRPELARAAVAEVQELGVPAVLHALGSVPHDRMPVWLNAADAILMTSAYEGSPNVVKEALACGRPVVSVDVGDVRDRIGGVAGCYVAESDSKSLARALSNVAAGTGRAEGRRAVEGLSLESVNEKVLAVYETVAMAVAATSRPVDPVSA